MAVEQLPAKSPLIDGKNRTPLPPKFPESPSMAVLPSAYRFRVYDLQICLWLTAAAIYRGLERFEDARVSISEADKLLESLIKIDAIVKNSPSKIFQNEEFNMTSLTLNPIKRPSKPADTARWGVVQMYLRRTMADIAFEVCCRLM